MDSKQFHAVLAAHSLRLMAFAQRDGRRIDLDQLATALDVRRRDVRATLSQLHREGLLDVTRMRLTLRGFAVGIGLAAEKLKPLRALPAFRVAAA
jgi:hypothetical protein